MERSPFEDLVRRALLDVNYQEFQQIAPQIDAIAYAPSPRYLTWERKFLAAPFAFAKKHARPAWQRFLRTAACIILAVSVAFGGLMAASPTARAWVQQIFAQWFGEYARFSFSGNAGQETGEWKTTWLPEGFELVEESSMGSMTILLYKDEKLSQIRFIYGSTDGANFSVDNEHQAYDPVLINGDTGYLLQATLPGKMSYLIWSDFDSGIAFKLATTGEANDLVKIAEGIKKSK